MTTTYNDSGEVILSSIASLSDIQGVGEKVKNALIEHFGNESIALKVILDSRVDLVASVPGIGGRQAVNIVKAAYESQFGVSSNMILRSQDVRKIFESVIEIIRGYANTGYAKDKLFLYFPLPPSRIDEIHERQRYFGDATEVARGMNPEQREKIGTFLGQIRALYKRLKHKRLDGRVIITNDEKVFDKLIKERIDRWCPVYLLSQGESGAEYAQGYDLVIYISPLGVYDDSIDLMDNVEVLGKDWSLANIIPERTVSFYSRNYRVIDAACSLAEEFNKLRSNSSMTEFESGLDRVDLTSIN
ncbi:MAG: hypothetical protein ACTSQZ_09850 [Candidatus Thorarchaeota archaeon]